MQLLSFVKTYVLTQVSRIFKVEVEYCCQQSCGTMGLLSHRHFIQRRFNFIITEPAKVYPPLEYQVPSQGQPSFQQQGQGMPAFPPSYETHPPVITQQPRKMILQSLLP